MKKGCMKQPMEGRVRVCCVFNGLRESRRGLSDTLLGCQIFLGLSTYGPFGLANIQLVFCLTKKVNLLIILLGL